MTNAFKPDLLSRVAPLSALPIVWTPALMASDTPPGDTQPGEYEPLVSRSALEQLCADLTAGEGGAIRTALDGLLPLLQAHSNSKVCVLS